jgi:hypothetical protein
VAAADGRLLIGARQGVLAVDRANLSSIETYADPYLQSEHGFSNVAAAGEQIWAIHSDGGVVTWRLGTGERPACVLRPAQLGGQRPRQLLVLGDNRILIAAGNQLLLLESDQAPQPMDELASPVVALLLCDDRLAIASEDGTISVRDPRTLAPISRFQPTGRIAAAAAMPWLGSARLLLASCDGPIFSIGLEDQLVMQYSGVTGSVRAIAATAGKVAAMTADRQRVVIWNAWNGRAPAAQIQLSTVARHRVADLAFA